METLRDKILLILIDKGLLALVATLFGFILARGLERYRRRQLVVGELAKLQATALIETVALFTEYEAKINAVLRLDKPPDIQNPEREPILRKAIEVEERLRNLLDKNKFLLGDLYYGVISLYAEEQTKRMLHALAGDKDALRAAWKAANDLRHQMAEFLPPLERVRKLDRRRWFSR
jgi:Ni,Fe-hydrogenase III large subunit